VLDLKQIKPILKLVIVAIVGAILASFGLSVSEEKIEQAVESVMSDKKASSPSLNQELSYKVLSVIDGDTIVVAIEGNKETVRVLGINTPETKHSPQGEECYGEEASGEASKLLQNMEVKLEVDPTQDTRDKYNRLLAYITLPDGRDFGQVMIADGFAYEYTFMGRKYKNQALYQQSEEFAKAQAVGLWNVCKE